MENQVIELAQDKDGVYKPQNECDEGVIREKRYKKQSNKVKQEPKSNICEQDIRNNPLYQFLDGAEMSMNLINKAAKMFNKR